MAAELGATFRDPTRKAQTHLMVIISHPGRDRKVVVTNFTSWKRKKGQDSSCIIQPEEYGVLSHTSCIYFRGSYLVPVERLECAAERDILQWSEPVPEHVLDKIHKGAAETELMPEECEELLEEQNLLPEEPTL